MTDNVDDETEPREDIKADLQSEKNEVLEKLKTVVAEEIKNSQKQKFDEFAEKLQSIEDAVSKMSILSNNPCNAAPKSVKKFILKHEFKDPSKFKSFVDTHSDIVEYFNAYWYITAEYNYGNLDITIYCDPNLSDSIETKLVFKLPGYNNVTKIMEHCFQKVEGEYDYLQLEDIRDKWDIPKNVKVEVEVEILKMIGAEKKKLRVFDESQKDVSDVVLAVQETRFYVSKMYLASQSTYFKTLFLGGFSESKKSEITLTGIDADEFQHFLEVLYGEFAIDDSTVEGILLIADLYDTPMVTKKSEMFLLEKSKKEFNKKLQLSSKYRLEELKDQCLAKINTLDNVRELLPGDLSDLDPSVGLTILQKCVSSK